MCLKMNRFSIIISAEATIYYQYNNVTHVLLIIMHDAFTVEWFAVMLIALLATQIALSLYIYGAKSK